MFKRDIAVTSKGNSKFILFRRELAFFVLISGKMEGSQHFDKVRFVYSTSAGISFCLGMFLNVLLVWLILNKTAKAMKMYSRLLLHSCVMDILIVIVSTLVQPIPIVDHGYRALFQNGFFRHLPQPYAYMLNILWIQLMLFFLASTTAQFIFRYFLLSKDGQIPSRVVWLLGIAAFLLNFFHIVLLVWADYPRPEHYPKMEELSKLVELEAGITDVHFSSFTYARSMPWIVHCVVMVFLFSSCYAVIGVCAVKIRRYVGKAFAGSCSSSGSCAMTKLKEERMREYNNQITSALIVQAILPTFEVFAMSVQILLPILYPKDTTIFIIVYTAIPLYFAPVLNPLATILLVKPYRQFVLNIVLRRGTRVTSNFMAHTEKTQQSEKSHKEKQQGVPSSFTPVGPTTEA